MDHCFNVGMCEPAAEELINILKKENSDFISEERRVRKECRSQRAPYHLKIKECRCGLAVLVKTKIRAPYSQQAI